MAEHWILTQKTDDVNTMSHLTFLNPNFLIQEMSIIAQ